MTKPCWDVSTLGTAVGPETCRPIPSPCSRKGPSRPITRIWDEWERDHARRQTTFRDDTWSIGDATVTSLHPLRPVDPTRWSNESKHHFFGHARRVARPAPSPGRRRAQQRMAGDRRGFPFPGLNRHAAMKVPHHGSREAIHPSYADGDPGRFWVITPFYLQRLPRHEDANSRGGKRGAMSSPVICRPSAPDGAPVSSRQRDPRARHHDPPELDAAEITQ